MLHESAFAVHVFVHEFVAVLAGKNRFKHSLVSAFASLIAACLAKTWSQMPPLPEMKGAPRRNRILDSENDLLGIAIAQLHTT